MKNLKITINFEGLSLLNRYLTIDSILLALHFNKLREKGEIKGYIDTEEYIESNKDKLFLEYKKGVLSGSIWYLPKDKPIWLNNMIVTKKIEKEKIYETLKKKVDTSRGEFKAGMFGFEVMELPQIYFYVRGDKEYIEELLKDLKYVGKKGSIGLGKVKSYEVEEIDEDKSFMLDETTPVKPLPLKEWSIKSKKVAFYRALPPYYERKNIEPCYMPTRALIEMKDRSYENEVFEYINIPYISPAEFARKSGYFKEVELFGKLSKKVKFVNDNKEERCIVCGKIEKEGLKGNPKNILPNTFNDYAFLDRGDFICSNCFWSMKQEKNLGNTLITNDKVVYLQGKNMEVKGAKEQQKFRDEFFRNMDLLKPPFVISLKSTANSQHTLFKSKVAISNAIIPMSHGTEEEIIIDVELLKQAIKDMEEITKQHSCIKKSHLLNFEKITEPFPRLSKKCNQEDIEVLMSFWKKYDRSIRKIMNRIML